MMLTRRSHVLLLTLAAGFALASVHSAEAGFRRDRGYNGQDGYVVANSRFGNGSVRGRVREGRNGLQVQLPGGTWEYCRASCSETLRVEVLDMFEYQGQMMGYGTAAQECGVFGCLGASWPY